MFVDRATSVFCPDNGLLRNRLRHELPFRVFHPAVLIRFDHPLGLNRLELNESSQIFGPAVGSK